MQIFRPDPYFKDTGKAGQSSEIVAAVNIKTDAVSEFVGFDNDECDAKILETHPTDNGFALVVDRSPLYVEKGGQLGDLGTIDCDGNTIPIVATSSIGDALVLHVENEPPSENITIKIGVRTEWHVVKASCRCFFPSFSTSYGGFSRPSSGRVGRSSAGRFSASVSSLAARSGSASPARGRRL